MTKKTELRRSCTHCRARKIACSGERICTACRDRSIECVYSQEAAKGRPRTNAAPAASSENGADRDMVNTTVWAEIDAMFRENFGGEPQTAPSNVFQDRVATFNRNLAAGKMKHGASTAAGSVSYPGFLALVTQDLVEMVAIKFGHLDCHPFFGPGERFYRQCMLQDTTERMFEPTSPTDVFDDYSPHLITQLLEVWFNNHPLSILVSKALLLRDLRSQSANKVLLAVLLADAHHFSDDAVKGSRMLQWAISQLHLLPAGKADIITAQITLLLGWYHACHCHLRRAVCYIGYACRISSMLKCELHESPPTNQTQINGIDQGSVDAELIHNLCWSTLAITTWAFIQMDMSLADVLPTQLMQILPANTEAESTLLQLDRATNNLSTLKPQLSSLQSIWLLAHVTSLSANMYALYPRPASRIQSAQQPWQDLVLHRLDSLRHQGRNIAQICNDSYDAILDVIEMVQTESTESKSASALLAFYLAVAIQLLFPHENGNCKTQPLVLSYYLIQRLSQSMHKLKQIFPYIRCAVKQDTTQTTNIGVAALHFYILALDASGRALINILTQIRLGEQQPWQEHLASLFMVGSHLHDLFEDDVLLQDHRWRLVKRQLKTACKKWDEVKAAFSSNKPQSSTLTEDADLSSQPTTSLSTIPPFEYSFALFDDTSALSALPQEDSIFGSQQHFRSHPSSHLPTFYPNISLGSLDVASNPTEPPHQPNMFLPLFSPGSNHFALNSCTQAKEMFLPFPLPESDLLVTNQQQSQRKRSCENLHSTDKVSMDVTATMDPNTYKRQRTFEPDTQNT